MVENLKVSFWPLLIGLLLLIFGIAGLAKELGGIEINVPWWPIIALIIAIWILSHAFKRET
jgi:hypothetical protein